jgi:CRP-like cAMP-binding protein
LVGTAVRGDGFGEIALVRNVPRQASVTAVTDGLVYSLDKAHFVQTLSGHASAASAVGEVVDQHLAGGPLIGDADQDGERRRDPDGASG